MRLVWSNFLPAVTATGWRCPRLTHMRIVDGLTFTMLDAWFVVTHRSRCRSASIDVVGRRAGSALHVVKDSDVSEPTDCRYLRDSTAGSDLAIPRTQMPPRSSSVLG